MGKSKKKLIIIGGGITGLSAAFYAEKWSEEQQIPIDITLLEKSNELGGKIQTIRRNNFVIERGPESFLARKQPIMTLIKDLKLENELASTNPNASTNYILHKGKLHKMPPGLMLGIPTQLTPFMKTGLISPVGKMRAVMDLCLPRKKTMEDESLGNFIERRLGKEVLDHITEPLLGGIYAGDTRFLSLQATFPHFSEMEQSHRSLILGMLASKVKVSKQEELPARSHKSIFLTFKNGMDTLVNHLEKSLQSVNILRGKEVQNILPNGQGYDLELDGGDKLYADGIIMAIPTFLTQDLLTNISALDWLKEINYVSVANIALAFDKKDITFDLNGSGFVIPRKEGRTLTACTWSSSKWFHTAETDKVLLRCYVGRGGSEDWLDLSDEQLIGKVRKDIEEIMGIKAKPLFHELTRLYKSMPQYPVEHVKQLKTTRELLNMSAPGIYLCGAGYEGVGVPDCIQQGKRASEKVLDFFKQT